LATGVKKAHRPLTLKMVSSKKKLPPPACYVFPVPAVAAVANRRGPQQLLVTAGRRWGVGGSVVSVRGVIFREA
jgi:hypothetical protein